MNCRRCQAEAAAFVEGLLDATAADQIERHLSECPDCRSEVYDVRQIATRLSADGQAAFGHSLEGRVMDRIIQQQALQLRSIQMQNRRRLIRASGAVVAATMLIALTGLLLTRPDNTLSAAEVLAQGAEAVGEVSSIHIRARMRTYPADNFSQIDPKTDPVPIQLWKEFGEQAKWRIEKPGRVVVMDGTSTVMHIKSGQAVKLPSSESAFDTDWFHRLAAVQSSVTDELRSALAKGWSLTLTHDKDKSGVPKSTVVVEARTELEDGDYLKNRFLGSSDNRRVYHFDQRSGQLDGFEIYLDQADGDVLVFEVTEINYNQPIEPSLFSLDLPEDVVFAEQPTESPENEKDAQTTPEESARAFFEACAEEDWDACGKFGLPVTDKLKKFLGGLEIVKIGEPFQSKQYAGWFVPYEIKLNSGQVRKHNLALRNDNPAKRFVVDGGI